MNRLILSLLIMLFCTSACNRTDNSFRDQFRWISGKWMGKDGETTVIENWKWNKYRYEGEGFRIFNGDTTTHEKLFLQDFGGVIGYTALVNGKGPYTFGLSSNDNTKYRFTNTDHDFPAIVEYKQQSDSTLLINLMSMDHPHSARVSYQLKRRK